ncbi:hypothetical protein [Methylopila turkensis]|uniref:Anti-sigma factor n=1 Tax=Methylopila turkensis TaxID=1437816 RepID=A0A9W6JPR0_9HYPH|nr:hypothetical protein [Methylopila turkensis]GLK79745.1 hypothetical protein GCM10008174_14860 [Methylopila turkensis]
MDKTSVPDDRLAALADGELPADEASALRARIDRDAALADRFAVFVETRALLAPEPAAEAEAGLDRLAAAIRASGAEARRTPALSLIEGGLAPAQRQPAAARPGARPAARFRYATPALAASLALVVGGALGFAVGRGEAPGSGSAGDVVAALGDPAVTAAISTALERTPSGEAVSWSTSANTIKGAVSVIATHAVGQGVCREYEASVEGRAGGLVALGCRLSDGGWRTEIVARKAEAEGYAAASGASVVENALEAMGSAGPLSADDEKERIEARWSRRE